MKMKRKKETTNTLASICDVIATVATDRQESWQFSSYQMAEYIGIQPDQYFAIFNATVTDFGVIEKCLKALKIRLSAHYRIVHTDEPHTIEEFVGKNPGRAKIGSMSRGVSNGFTGWKTKDNG